MTKAHAVALGILCGVLGASMLNAGDFANYRGLQFGMNLSAALKQTGTNPDDVRLIHQRPAVIQEIDWQLPSTIVGASANVDPVKEALLCFFNGQLFRIVVTYDRDRVEGMTTEDMVEGISTIYGASKRPTTEIDYHSNYGEMASVLARWEDPEYAYNLVRTGDRSSFAMVSYSKRLESLARAAIVAAVRLKIEEAPQRELEKEQRREEAERLVLGKARLVNKPNFRP